MFKKHWGKFLILFIFGIASLVFIFFIKDNPEIFSNKPSLLLRSEDNKNQVGFKIPSINAKPLTLFDEDNNKSLSSKPEDDNQSSSSKPEDNNQSSSSKPEDNKNVIIYKIPSTNAKPLTLFDD